MNRIFDHFGVTVDDIDSRTFHLSAGPALHRRLPRPAGGGDHRHLRPPRALGREDIGFLTWDHPMVRGAIDLMLSSEKGNSAIVVWREPSIQAPPNHDRGHLCARKRGPPRLHVDRFLPPTPVRVAGRYAGRGLQRHLQPR